MVSVASLHCESTGADGKRKGRLVDDCRMLSKQWERNGTRV